MLSAAYLDAQECDAKFDGVKQARQTLAVARQVGQHHGDLRRALIDAALEAIAEGDPAELSLRRLAARAGVSRAAPYHHFASKDALLAALAHEGFVQLGEAQDGAPTPDDPVDALRQLATRYVTFATAHPTHYSVMFSVTLTDGKIGEEGERLEQIARARFAVLCAAIARVGSCNEAEARRRGVVSWSMAHGAVQVAMGGMLEGLSDLDAEALARRVGDATVAIALAPSSSPA